MIPGWIVKAVAEFGNTRSGYMLSANKLFKLQEIIAKHEPKRLTTSIDETNAALIGAITQARDEMKAGRCIEAGITLTMALQEHKQRLIELSKREEH